MIDDRTPQDHGPALPAGGPLDGHLDALGSALGNARRRAERRRRRALVGAPSALLLVLMIGLGAAVAVPGGRKLDPVQEARAALDPGDSLIHYRFRVSIEGLDQDCSPTPAWSAVWRETGPAPRWRFVQTPDEENGCGATSISGLGHVAEGPEEWAADPGARVYTSSSPEAGWVERITEAAPTMLRPNSFLPLAGTSDGPDPVTMILRLLRSGQVRDLGERDEGSRRIRTLRGTREIPPGPDGAREPLPIEIVVDAETWAPIRMRLTDPAWPLADGTDTPRTTTVITFGEFWVRPLAGNEQLLEPTVPADADVTTMTYDDWRSEIKARFERQNAEGRRNAREAAERRAAEARKNR